MKELNGLISLKPGNPKNKSVFLFRILMLIAVLGCSLLIFLSLHASSQKGLLPIYLSVAGLFAILMIYSISGKVVREIIIDTEKAFLKISYFTLFNQNKFLELPLNEIEYSYKWQPSKYPPKKYRFKVYRDNVSTFYMDSTDDGFSENQFTELIEKLDTLKIKRRN